MTQHCRSLRQSTFDNSQFSLDNVGQWIVTVGAIALSWHSTCTDHVLNGLLFLSTFSAAIVICVWILANMLLAVAGTNELILHSCHNSSSWLGRIHQALAVLLTTSVEKIELSLKYDKAIGNLQGDLCSFVVISN